MREVSSLPIVAQLTLDEDAQTLAGVAARDAFERLRALDVVAIGANCGVGPVAALAALSEMSAQGDGFALDGPAERRPAQPLGGPHRLSPRDAGLFRRVAAQARLPGADHRRLLRNDARADRGHPRGGRQKRQPRLPMFVVEREIMATVRQVGGRTAATEAEAGEWVITTPGTNMEAMLDVLRGSRSRARFTSPI